MFCLFIPAKTAASRTHSAKTASLDSSVVIAQSIDLVGGYKPTHSPSSRRPKLATYWRSSSALLGGINFLVPTSLLSPPPVSPRGAARRGVRDIRSGRNVINNWLSISGGKGDPEMEYRR